MNADGTVRVTLRDPKVVHQIVIRVQPGAHHILVSCNCLRRKAGWIPIGVKPSWEPGEQMAAWRVHLPAEAAQPLEAL